MIEHEPKFSQQKHRSTGVYLEGKNKCTMRNSYRVLKRCLAKCLRHSNKEKMSIRFYNYRSSTLGCCPVHPAQVQLWLLATSILLSPPAQHLCRSKSDKQPSMHHTLYAANCLHCSLAQLILQRLLWSLYKIKLQIQCWPPWKYTIQNCIEKLWGMLACLGMYIHISQVHNTRCKKKKKNKQLPHKPSTAACRQSK